MGHSILGFRCHTVTSRDLIDRVWRDRFEERVVKDEIREGFWYKVVQ